MTNQSHLGRKAADTLYRNHFGAFVYAAFEVVNPGLKLRPNWHIDCVCHHLQLMVTGRNAVNFDIEGWVGDDHLGHFSAKQPLVIITTKGSSAYQMVAAELPPIAHVADCGPGQR